MAKEKSNPFGKKLTYFYIKNIKKWMFCPACQGKQNGRLIISKDKKVWHCNSCGYSLTDSEFSDNYVFWFCDGDGCNAYLNNQEGFNRHFSKNRCKNCGYENDTTFDNIKGICSDCGKIIPASDKTLCNECKKQRIQKAKEWLITAGKVALGAAAVVGTICLAASGTGDELNSKNLPSFDGNDDEQNTMKCAFCGNVEANTLWDEDDTFYCSKCHHRTRKDTGEDDLVKCPYCHRMRDRKAYYCRYCNDGTWLDSTPKEFEEIDSILKEMGY